MIGILERRADPLAKAGFGTRPDPEVSQAGAMIDYLRRAVLLPPAGEERFHAIFLDERRAFVADAPMGKGHHAALSLRMRELFQTALTVGARGLIVAHNHPSGECRPSARDIGATARLKDVAAALDIELVDHLIITQSAFYSMRAGGDL